MTDQHDHRGLGDVGPSDKTLELCSNGPVLSDYLRKHPKSSPGKAARRLYKRPFVAKRMVSRFVIKHDLYKGRGEPSKAHLDKLASAGHWSTRPSDLFLKIWGDVLLCLDRDPLAGVTSPKLMGLDGVLPLTILSVIPDIMRHYANCILMAEEEVLVATNFLQPSNSTTLVADALRELSKRVGERKGKKVAFKMIYDRGTYKQAWENHSPATPQDWMALTLPDPKEVPNVSMQIVNFHRPFVGTFHAKFAIIDRKVALISSNNIQDRPNLELMHHLEGPIVQAFYDTFLISFNNQLQPALPMIAKGPPPPVDHYKFRDENPYLSSIDLAKASKAARAMLRKEADQERSRAPKQSPNGFADVVMRALQNKDGGTPGSKASSPTKASPADVQQMFGGTNKTKSPSDANGGNPALRRAMDKIKNDSQAGAIPEDEQTPSQSNAGAALDRPNTSAAHPDATPQADRTTEPASEDNAKDTTGSTPIHRAKTPAGPMPGVAMGDLPNAHDPVHGINGSASPGGKSAAAATAASTRLRSLSHTLNAGAQSEAHATIADAAIESEFNPHYLHHPHAPVPMAMCSRKPHGAPGHQDIRVPQCAAWLAACRYAKENIFIQTPTFNARPIVNACVEAAVRGVTVTLFISIGFNDKSESLPFQGGTNEEVVFKMYDRLRKVKKQQFLKVYWYIGKDQTEPLPFVIKQRNCHVKFMSVDSRVIITGSGNMDSQSWFHSQEINVLIDSRELCADMARAFMTQQNTHLMGLCDDTGTWRRADGKTIRQIHDEDAAERKRAAKAAPKKNDSANGKANGQADGQADGKAEPNGTAPGK
ncbi:uncharacterized protein L969DRAFT_90487 [Mixia osmundae IAM 14324]|uniref:PLD phosphodiesterase domain-containing protein n=1 Tax=Mixia osmundae (strain CBS 9802 / IAM 14324 / JCM 22182 / KY 12970) TaxID=764103 RepID=G7E2L4_MIXOS|nr:uncharacterized protein L969DRAFT_90487 [Mixia osmundae IAM 14324]KEI36941.1 hypothetical protein L969DRAFT_90487 [Mixia osmundae IAM 14324]GAA97074.1 hypothetical protein E5Q_03749 [Mixia osmundae IAM 14324]